MLLSTNVAAFSYDFKLVVQHNECAFATKQTLKLFEDFSLVEFAASGVGASPREVVFNQLLCLGR